MRTSIQKTQLKGTILIAVSSMLLATLAAAPSVNNYLRSSRNAEQLSRFEIALRSVWLVSAERGPSNNLMGADVPDEALVIALASARKATDEKLAQLRVAFEPELRQQPQLANVFADIKQQLSQSRTAVDDFVDLPVATRDRRQMADAIQLMFQAADSINTLRGRLAAAIIKETPDVAMDIATTATAGVMRDRIGRLGSYVVMSLSASPSERQAYRAKFDADLQSLALLKASLNNYTAAYLGVPKIDMALKDLESSYFGQALAYAQNTIAMAVPDARPSVTDFSQTYIRGMQSADILRDLVLAETRSKTEAMKDKALSYGIASVLLAAIAMYVLLRLMAVYKTALFQPMQSVRSQIAAIAEGNLGDVEHQSRVAPEVRKMFQELDFLREQLRQKRDMEEQQHALAEQLRRLSETDALTGVFNRRALEKSVRKVLDDRELSATLTVMIVDIDHFKSINDKFGHAMGDLALQKTADLLKGALRKSDILARYGGEEFVIVLHDVSHATATATADRLRRAIQANVIDDEHGISLTASFGVVWQETRTVSNWENLIAVADERLYQAKRAGRNRVWATYYQKIASA
ncbi:GGDEF domain-containing protein [Agrobacterium sp. NPDC090273]|uniref:GGDEF domain-containing protein n=1 Tax=Agrobacterium sp. NPDC090273 TaxID=3363919 RepID=UPI003839D660